MIEEKKNKRYVWIRYLPDEDIEETTLIYSEDELIRISNRADYDPKNDLFYELGNEVKIKTSIEVVKPVAYRSASVKATSGITDNFEREK